jgi:hypothetical protein
MSSTLTFGISCCERNACGSVNEKAYHPIFLKNMLPIWVYWRAFDPGWIK